MKRLQTEQRLSHQQFADALTAAGEPIARTAAAKLGQGQRRVDVDTLVALAVALGVNPSTLLLPPTAREDETVELTDKVSTSAYFAWRWADGATHLPIAGESADEWEDAQETFRQRARPTELRRADRHDLVEEIEHLLDVVRSEVAHGDRPGEFSSAALEAVLFEFTKYAGEQRRG